MTGASEFRIFWKIVMPSRQTGLVDPDYLHLSTALDDARGVYIYSEQLKTLSYAFSQILLGGAVTIARAGVSGAVGLLMMIPDCALYCNPEQYHGNHGHFRY